MPHPFDAFVTRHRLGRAARAELQRMIDDASSGRWAPGELGEGPGEVAEVTEVTEVTEVSADEAADATDVDEAPPTSASDDTRPPGFRDRYALRGRLGAGGMGEVERAWDRVLEREVAVKTLRLDKVASEAAIDRFRTEATITAGLAHPVIVPIYDRGLRPGGSPWYTMKLIEGQTLGAAVQDGLGVRRLVDAVRRVAEAVAFAHRAGIVHRDIKPANIMVGAFGEVLLLDWGLAMRVDVDRSTGIAGTPAYMAPEQLTGRPGRPSDVYALSMTLDAALRGGPRWRGRLPAIIAARRAEPWPSIEHGPEPLRPLMHAALCPDPDQRPSAADFAEHLRRWADGELGRARARVLLNRALERRPAAAEARANAAALRQRAAAALDAVPPYAPIDDKRAGWALHDAADVCLAEARGLDAEQLTLLRSALELAPDLPEVRAAVNDQYRARLLRAEAAGDVAAAAEYRALLVAHDAPGNTEWLRGDGRVSLLADAPQTTVEVLRFTERDRRLEAVPIGETWTAPLVERPLPIGRYLLRLSAPGRHTVSYPIEIERDGRWTGVRPGDARPHPVHLPPLGALGPDDVYVPAGWTRIGGDPDAPDAHPEARVWVDGFVVGRDPVCHGAYLAWLDGLLAAGRGDEARRYAPRERTVGGGAGQLFYGGGTRGPFTLVDAYDQSWTPAHPVVRVDWWSAAAFAAARAEREGRRWRLVHSVEWDKAARGVDRRPFPWGQHFDPTWASMIASHSEDVPPMIRAVHDAPGDVSPYGMRGAAGNVRDRCLDVYRSGLPVPDGGICRPEMPTPGPDDFMTIKGGNYSSQARFCRVAGRFAAPPGQRLYGVGFRLARRLDPYAR